MRAVQLASAFADPEHVRRAVVPAAAERVLTGEGLFVAEQQRLVAGVEVDLVQVVVVLGVDAAGPHEPQGSVDLGGDLVVGAALGAGCDELLRPGVDPAEVGETALGEGPQQVQRRRRLVVGLHQTFGRRRSGPLGRGRVVDDVAAERRQVELTDTLEGADRGLANWPAMRPTLTTGTPSE